MNHLSVGTAIRSARKLCAMTLEDLGERVGVSHAFLSKIENDKVKPSADLLKRLNMVFDEEGVIGFKSEIKVLLGEYDEVTLESDLFTRLLKEGRIEFNYGDDVNFKILSKPYYNINYLFETENDITFDIIDEPYQQAIKTIKIPSDLKFELYKLLNKTILQYVIERPELLDTFTESGMNNYKKTKNERRIKLAEAYKDNEELEAVLRRVMDDSYLL